MEDYIPYMEYPQEMRDILFELARLRAVAKWENNLQEMWALSNLIDKIHKDISDTLDFQEYAFLLDTITIIGEMTTKTLQEASYKRCGISY